MKEQFVCHKCGKKVMWNNSEPDAFITKNSCHCIKLGRMGYGSNLDGCDINFCLCDDCLVEFLDTFDLKNEVYNSGSNYYKPKENADNNKVNMKCIKDRCRYYFSSDLYEICKLDPDTYLSKEDNCTGIEKAKERIEKIASEISVLVTEMYKLSELENFIEKNQKK